MIGMLLLSACVSLPPQGPSLLPPQAPPLADVCRCAPECVCFVAGCRCDGNQEKRCNCAGCCCALRAKGTFPAWRELSRQAKAGQSSAVLFVGVTPRKVPGMLAGSQFTFPGCESPTIIVARWRGEWFERIDLPATATDAEIAAALAPRAIAAPAPTFFAPVSRAAFSANCST